MRQQIVELSDREHILARPNMYIGGIDQVKSTEYIFKDGHIAETDVTFVPGLLKIINEIIDNSVDVAIKSGFEAALNISVKMTKDYVEISDDGTGIPNDRTIQGNLLAELAWGRARAGSNFDDSNRTQIGMNGIGSFATNCFSTKFVGTSDDGRKRCTLLWTDNAQNFTQTDESESTGHGVTVKFWPDLERFGLSEITQVHADMIHQRLINLKLSFPEINFRFNNKKISVSSFKKYLNFFGKDFELVETDKYAVAILPNAHDDFKQFSYVNGLKIPDGGAHIDYIVSNVVNRVRDKLIKKFKSIKPGDIRNKFFVIAFLKNLPNAKFSSQSKEKITNSTGEISEYFSGIDFDAFSKRILKNAAIIDPITEVYKLKEELKRRQEMKSLEKPKKIKDEKYLPAIGKPKYLLIVEGECLHHDTPVLLEDFSTKPIRQVSVGDRLIGPDLSGCNVMAVATQLKECIEIQTSDGTVSCTADHRFKVLDTKDNTFKYVEASKISRARKRYKLLKTKINEKSRGLRVILVGRSRNGYYFTTDTNEFVRFTDKDTFTIHRDGMLMPCAALDLKKDDVVILSEHKA